MLQRIDNILQHNCLVDSDKSILLGVSGGPDSLSLLHVMHRLGYSLVVAHFDHGLRDESGLEARIVERFVEPLGLPFTLGESDTRAYADAHSLSIEEAARILRYRFLFEQAREYKVQAVAVGHTADDQVETVLMHLLRGSGLSGLGGMEYRSLPNAWSQTIPLLRPMLGIWRPEIEVYLQNQGLTWLQDHTNLELTYFRNRLRHELIPYLEDYNPQIRHLLWRTADILRADDQILEQLTVKAWDECVHEKGQGYVAFFIDRLRGQNLALQRRVIRKGMLWIRSGIRDLDYLTVARGIEFVNHGKQSSQIDLMSGVRLFLEEDRLFMAGYEADLPLNDWPQVPSDSELQLEIPGDVSLGPDWVVKAKPVDDVKAGRQLAVSNQDLYRAWIDLDGVRGHLIVRARRTGDRFKPLGLGGHTIKLSKFMINEKLPRRARVGWPVVCRGYPRGESGSGNTQDEIVWIPGMRLAHPYRLKSDTRRAAHIWLERNV